jgi:hypothetical protein
MKVQKQLFFFLFLITGITCYAGHVEKAFESLTLFDYFNAKKYFEAAQKKYPSISAYGLSVIFNRNDNPFFNRDSSLTLIKKSLLLYETASKAELNKMKLLSLTRATIENQKIKIENDAFASAEQLQTINVLNHFINFYPDSRHLKRAYSIRDSLAFEVVKNENTSEGYFGFMEKYPESDLYFEAKAKYERSLYLESTSDGTTDSFEKYIIAYPLSPYLREAHENLFRISSENNNDPDLLYNYVKKFPEGPFAENAWQRIYELSLTDFTEENLQKFREKYPEFPYPDKIKSDYALIRSVLLPYRDGDLWGFIDNEGKVVIEARYDFVENFSEGLAVISRKGKFGYILKTGEELIPPYYDEAESFHNNLAIVSENNKSGVINKNGKMVVPLIYSEISDYSEDLASASDGTYYGYINRNGNIVIPLKFISAGDFKNGTAICEKENGFGLIDTNGIEKIPFKFETLENYSYGLFKYRSDGKMGIISQNNEIITAAEYADISNCYENRCIVISDNSFGYLDSSGFLVIPIKFQKSIETFEKSKFTDKYAIVKLNNRYGVIDTSGKMVIDARYDELKSNASGIAAFKKNGKWGYLDISINKPIVLPKYDKADVFIMHNSIVMKNAKAGVIDEKGKEIVPVIYDALMRLDGKLFIANKNGKYGIVDKSNTVIIPFEYSEATTVTSGFIKLEKDSNHTSWFDINSNKLFSKE